MGNDKAKGRQSKKKSGYCERQKLVTIQNKNRRSAKRRNKLAMWEEFKKAEAIAAKL